MRGLWKERGRPHRPSPNGESMTYYPVPFLLSTEGYGFWLDSTFRNEFNLATDRPMLPPPWAFGPRRRINHDDSQGSVPEIQAMRDLDLAITAADDAVRFLPAGSHVGPRDASPVPEAPGPHGSCGRGRRLLPGSVASRGTGGGAWGGDTDRGPARRPLAAGLDRWARRGGWRRHAPLSKLPLLVRDGHLVVLLDPAFDTLARETHAFDLYLI